MSGFVLHPEAVADLEEIWEFIAAESSEAANRVVEEIYEAIGTLVRFPKMGQRPSGFDVPAHALSARSRLSCGLCARREAACGPSRVAWPS